MVERGEGMPNRRGREGINFPAEDRGRVSPRLARRPVRHRRECFSSVPSPSPCSPVQDFQHSGQAFYLTQDPKANKPTPLGPHCRTVM